MRHLDKTEQLHLTVAQEAGMRAEANQAVATQVLTAVRAVIIEVREAPVDSAIGNACLNSSSDSARPDLKLETFARITI